MPRSARPCAVVWRALAAILGSLVKRQKEALKQYHNDKMWFHRKYRDEKHEITQKMHMLKMEYLTVNGIKEGGEV